MYKILFLIVMLVGSNFAFAKKINLKAGLWEVKTKMLQDGKEIDPMAEINKMMATLPKEQREAMKKMMKGQMKKLNAQKLIKKCYTKEILEKGMSEALNSEKGCKGKVLSESSKEIKTSLICQGGVKGKATWKFHSTKKYTGDIKFESKDDKMALKLEGRFLKKSCGDVLPDKM